MIHCVRLNPTAPRRAKLFSVSNRRQPVHDRFHDDLVPLIEYRSLRADHPVVRTMRRAPDFEDCRVGTQCISRTYGVSPAHLFNSSANHSAGNFDRFNTKTHNNCRRKPSRSAQSAEEGILPRRLIYMRRLWIVSFAKAYDFLCGYVIGIKLLSLMEILEVHNLRHRLLRNYLFVEALP
jgi:hypothetical protein